MVVLLPWFYGYHGINSVYTRVRPRRHTKVAQEFTMKLSYRKIAKRTGIGVGISLAVLTGIGFTPQYQAYMREQAEVQAAEDAAKLAADEAAARRAEAEAAVEAERNAAAQAEADAAADLRAAAEAATAQAQAEADAEAAAAAKAEAQAAEAEADAEAAAAAARAAAAERAAEAQAAATSAVRRRTAVEIADVIEGDLVTLTTGETIRIIGIDAPNFGECGYLDAIEVLSMQVWFATTIEIHGDPAVALEENGELLRHLLFDGTPAGEQMLDAEMAHASLFGAPVHPGHEYEANYAELDKGGPNCEWVFDADGDGAADIDVDVDIDTNVGNDNDSGWSGPSVGCGLRGCGIDWIPGF
jgi:hypothetical protein